MALLDLAARNLRKHRLIVAHFNHQLRGEESDGDEAFVRAAAEGRGLEFIVGRGDVRGAARGISIEMAARKLRHDFLAKTAREFEADIVLAHHANDQIELFLMRVLRGVQGAGLGGMRDAIASSADGAVRILRPFLAVRKGELAAHVQDCGVAHREDSTNAQLEAERNRIRHEVVPQLEKRFGASYEEDFLGRIAEIQKLSDRTRAAAKAWLAEADDFLRLPAFLKSEVVCMQLEAAKIPVTGALVKALTAGVGKDVSIRAGETVSRDGKGRLHFYGEGSRAETKSVNLRERNSAEFGGVVVRWSFAAVGDLAKREGELCFDAERVGDAVTLRFWRPGDRVQLSGRGAERPLHEMFSRNKVTREERRRAIVATTEGGEIVWVEGLRITEKFKITAGTRRFLRWSWARLSGG